MWREASTAGGRQSADRAAPQVEADVCILGAGPVGIAIARELVGAGLLACLVESGGLAPDPATEALAAGESAGEPIHPPGENTRRAFGGASHAWDIATGLDAPHVRHMPLEPEDLAPRPWIPGGGWPLRPADLAAAYRRAQLACGLGPFRYDAAAWEEAGEAAGEARGARRLPLDPAAVTTEICQFGPASLFHRHYREELRLAERAGRLRLLLHATALRLVTEDGGRVVRGVLCARPDGTMLRVRARALVLACGGIQTARLLLLSDAAAAGGLGEVRETAGRWFHDHPLVFAGRLLPADPAAFARAGLYDIRVVRGVPVMGYLALAGAARRRLGLGAVASFLFPRPEPRATHALEAVRDGLRRARGGGAMPIGPVTVAKLLARRPGVALRGLAEAAQGRPVLSGFKAGGWSRQRPPGTGWHSFHVWQQVEQTPDAANRVTLGAARDRFGCPLPVVHWRWSAEDDARVARAQEVLAAALRAAGIGSLDPVRRDGRTDLSYPAGAHHPMGATRMHPDPRLGVVDADCRVHGVANLFVAGISVFPTGGAANPTLTAVALALRLADHLRQVLAVERVAPAEIAGEGGLGAR